MRQFMAVFALDQKHLFAAEKGCKIPHGQFAFAGSRRREFFVVGAGADGDAEADGNILKQQGAIGRGGCNFHASAKSGLGENVADLPVGAGLFDA